jgi:hypothetical protein
MASRGAALQQHRGSALAADDSDDDDSAPAHAPRGGLSARRVTWGVGDGTRAETTLFLCIC